MHDLLDWGARCIGIIVRAFVLAAGWSMGGHVLRAGRAVVYANSGANKQFAIHVRMASPVLTYSALRNSNGSFSGTEFSAMFHSV